MSSTSTIPSPQPQAKARNTGLLFAVWLLLLTLTLALWVEVQGRVWQGQYAYERYMEKRAHNVALIHWLWHQPSNYIRVLWPGHEAWPGPVAK